MADSIEKVEDFIYSVYLQNYDSHKEEIKSPLDEKTYIVDGAKLQSLNVIVDFELDKCYIEKSRINTAGNGLFAKNDILKDELITFYPSDIASYAPNGDLSKPGHVSIETYSQRFKIQFEKNIKKERENCAMINEYIYDLDQNYRIIGSPFFIKDTNYMGHFINDGAKSDSIESNKVYLTISSLKSNCRFYHLKDLLVAIIATKDIKKDEEFYITYGIEYWESYNKLKLDNPPELGPTKIQRQ